MLYTLNVGYTKHGQYGATVSVFGQTLAQFRAYSLHGLLNRIVSDWMLGKFETIELQRYTLPNIKAKSRAQLAVLMEGEFADNQTL